MAKRRRKAKQVLDVEKVQNFEFFINAIGAKNLYGIKQVGNLFRMVKIDTKTLIAQENTEDLRGIQIGKIINELESEAQ